jgi:hypothetical protein
VRPARSAWSSVGNWTGPARLRAHCVAYGNTCKCIWHSIGLKKSSTLSPRAGRNFGKKKKRIQHVELSDRLNNSVAPSERLVKRANLETGSVAQFITAHWSRPANALATEVFACRVVARPRPHGRRGVMRRDRLVSRGLCGGTPRGTRPPKCVKHLPAINSIIGNASSLHCRHQSMRAIL